MTEYIYVLKRHKAIAPAKFSPSDNQGILPFLMSFSGVVISMICWPNPSLLLKKNLIKGFLIVHSITLKIFLGTETVLAHILISLS